MDELEPCPLDEARKILWYCAQLTDGSRWENQYRRALKAVCDELDRRAAPENKALAWIPVNERLPETDTPVLCHCSNNHLQHLYQRVGYWSTDKVWHDSWDGREIPVDYWMPLPNARKPEE